MSRRFNFSAGPSLLPESVVRETQDAIWELEGCGMGVMETSHRGKPFLAVLARAKARLRTLMALEDDQEILFLHGGARTQFSQVPAALLRGGRAAYVDTDIWSAGALDEARRYGTVDVVWSSKGSGYDAVPQAADWQPPVVGTRYLHITTNNTVAGTQWGFVPDAGGAWLIGDISSDILSKPHPYGRYDLLYAGAQKNLGTAGVTLVVIRRSLLEACDPELPAMSRYPLHASKDSLYNTPSTIAIYVLERMTAWIEAQGGTAAVGEANRRRASALYAAIDQSGGFFRGRSQPSSRSVMNVTFSTPSPELDARFVTEANEAGLLGLKGHASQGGLRASLYNAQTDEAVGALVAFMAHFAQRAG